jgi:SanA protein
VLENRLDAAAELWRAGKVRTLVVSGDKSGHYDEPAAMRAGLLARGVPAAAIASDASGLRPREAVLRARDVLGHRHVLIVAQADTVGRALFVAHQAGIAASGFTARGVGFGYGAASDARRWLTAVVAWVDPRN